MLRKAILVLVLVLIGATLGVMGYRLFHGTSQNDMEFVAGWPWFEDSHFNLKFQYPPGWKVEKVDITNYHDESQMDLSGEDAALAGPDKYKTWIIRIVPPEDSSRGRLAIENNCGMGSAIIIEQPNRFCSTVSLLGINYVGAGDGEHVEPAANTQTHFVTAGATTSVVFVRSLMGICT